MIRMDVCMSLHRCFGLSNSSVCAAAGWIPAFAGMAVYAGTVHPACDDNDHQWDHW